MKSKFRKMIARCVVASMLLSMLPIAAFATNASVAHPVRFVEADMRFDTLGEAVVAANDAGFSSATLVVSDDTRETSEIPVTSNVTIVGANGSHIVSLAGSI
ncbi:MAG: hypothetical protein FWD84_01300 [Oscillospiraceae bacterium]|nr:hypothetical protein [Oscillospiraceae bacterium]